MRVGADKPRGSELNFDPVFTERVVRALDPLMHLYFRSEVRGVENFPTTQTLVIANHDGGMLPMDGISIGSAWHHRFGFQRPLAVLVHDMVMRLAGWINRLGGVLADRPHMEAVLDAGHSVMVYPGGSHETFRPYWERKQVTLGHRTGFIKQALRRRLLITPVVSVGMHETFFVLWRGGWLADRLGIRRHLRADVFPIVAGLPFGIWLGAIAPQLPLPAKLTVEVLPPIDVHQEAENLLGRPLTPRDIDDQPDIAHTAFHLVRDRMQRALDRLYAERRFPILG